LSCFFLFRWGS